MMRFAHHSCPAVTRPRHGSERCPNSAAASAHRLFEHGVNYVDLFLAKERGYFREEGLEPQLIQMSTNMAITANIAGELDGQAAIGSAIRGDPAWRAFAGRRGDVAPSAVLARRSTGVSVG